MPQQHIGRRGLFVMCAAALCILSGTRKASMSVSTVAKNSIIPLPVSIQWTGGTFMLAASAGIYVPLETPEVAAIGRYLAGHLQPATGYALPVTVSADSPTTGGILLSTSDDAALGEEGYELVIAPDSIRLTAFRPAGLFWGVQTLRQLFPPAIERSTVQAGPWTLPTGTIRDYPRFEWRGAMLDVARHFFGVSDVKRFIDLLAYYKMNRFHLHLSDDQGWRLMINRWPKLATYGGSTEVGGGAGGYYTQAEYAEIVAYAQSRYIVLIPEIDTPGHTNAALASYTNLNCNGTLPSLYTGTKVGFSSLCIDKEDTYTFLDDVIGEIAALTPGPYIHIGGDEASATDAADYVRFVDRIQAIVKAHDKTVVGWEEIARGKLLPDTIVQYWNGTAAHDTVQQGAKVLMSPASKAYLDMKYDPSTPIGLNWAAYIEVSDGYNWDPAEELAGLPESEIIGIEAPLWSETLQTLDDIEFMALPRLPGYAEIGWSPAAARDWNEYRIRLGAHGARFTALGLKFYRSAQVPWQL